MLILSGTVVVLFGVALILLGALIVFRPKLATRFLKGFASSPATHYGEQAVRLIVGAALIHYSPEMRASDAFHVLGWLLAGTAAALLLVPWRWHHQFAQQAIPLVLRFSWLYAAGSAALGAAILYSVASNPDMT
ncbi:MAG: hypothetical protein RL885_03485 [Planctomycetota bacterium]